jgi:hypothetical protein
MVTMGMSAPPFEDLTGSDELRPDQAPCAEKTEIARLREDVHKLQREQSASQETHEYGLRLGERFGLYAARVAALEDRVEALDRRLGGLEARLVGELDRRLDKAERRLERVKWNTLLLWPVTAPICALARVIVNKFRRTDR